MEDAKAGFRAASNLWETDLKRPCLPLQMRRPLVLTSRLLYRIVRIGGGLFSAPKRAEHEDEGNCKLVFSSNVPSWRFEFIRYGHHV